MKTTQLIFLSQAIALINCAVGIVVEVNNTFFQVNAPFSLSMVFNGLMLLFFSVKSARKRIGWRNNCWILLFTLTDVASNICIDYSYGYTNITSAILLSSLATPFSMLFSFLILKSRFSYEQIISSVVSLVLAAAYTLIDAEMSNSRIYGNLLAILGGGVGYGINTTINELIIKRGINQYQIVSRLGFFGVIIATILVISVERKIYKTMKPAAAGMFFAYGAAKISFYMIQMYSITKASAVFLNCSCLLTNFYTIFVSIFWLKVNFHPNQIVPGMLLIFSIILFDISEGKIQSQKEQKIKDSKNSLEQKQQAVVEAVA